MRGVTAIGIAVCGFFLRLCSNCEVGAACELPDRVLGTDSGAQIGTTGGIQHRCDAWLPFPSRLPPGSQRDRSSPDANTAAAASASSSEGVCWPPRGDSTSPLGFNWASTSGTRYYLLLFYPYTCISFNQPRYPRRISQRIGQCKYDKCH